MPCPRNKKLKEPDHSHYGKGETDRQFRKPARANPAKTPTKGLAVFSLWPVGKKFALRRCVVSVDEPIVYFLVVCFRVLICVGKPRLSVGLGDKICTLCNAVHLECSSIVS